MALPDFCSLPGKFSRSSQTARHPGRAALQCFLPLSAHI
jgi:hypothetical protein